MTSLIYLASPYTAPSFGVMRLNAKRVGKIAKQLIAKGHLVYSPIAHGHFIDKSSNCPPVPYDVWADHSKKMLERCDVVYVACMLGWSKSKGIEEEVHYAEALDKPVFYLDPKTLSVIEVPPPKEVP